MAEASIREAQQLMDELFPRRPALTPSGRTARKQPPSRPPRPVRAAATRAVVRVVPPRVRAWNWTRRRLGGVALTLAFVPVGWMLSALGSDATAPVRAIAGSGTPGGAVSVAGVDGETVSRLAGTDFRAGAAVGSRRVKGSSRAAHVRGASVKVYGRPRGKIVRQLDQRVIEGQKVPLVLLVRGRQRGWLRVQIPGPPNGGEGWIRSARARVVANTYRVRIDVKRHRLELRRGGRRVLSRKIAVGKAASPTPTGVYYVTDLIRARDPKGLYGPYSFGLSAHTEVATDFRSNSGQIGLHGTNAPGALGTDVSAGCIRVSNETIRELARIVPLGTPVHVRQG